jgi:putative metalloprotease
MMKLKSIVSVALIVFFGFSKANAQINFGEKAMGALQKGITGFLFSDADAALLSKAAVDKMDLEYTVATVTDPYAIRLNSIFEKHKNENGLVLNYKVYKVSEVNAFATADGSVRVFSGLMDIMDDYELLAVIGHEIGHVANSDSRDAIKAAYKKEALIDAVSSQSDKLAAITDGQLAKLGSAMIDSKHSRKQETEADYYSYDFMKRNNYDVNAVESAFAILAKRSQGADASFLDRMMSSHPDSQQRADNARKRAEDDGLYKVYVKQVPKPVAKKTVAKKVVVKKAVAKKKKK